MEAVIPVDTMFERYPAYYSDSAELDKLLSNGNTFPRRLMEESEEAQWSEESWLRVYDSGKRFIGIYEYHSDVSLWKPKKIFLGGD